LCPVASFPIGNPDFRTGGEDGLIVICDSRDSIQEEGKVRILRESCELADTVLSDIDQFPDLGVLKETKELLGRLLGESDGQNR
jgi:hypothetical protein